MNEIWRAIAGYPGYEISDAGNVRSVDRVIVKVYARGPVPTRLKGRILKRHLSGCGYLFARLGERGHAYIHDLVLRAFVGERPVGHQAAHGDGDPLNNTLANLRWASPKANNADKILHGTALFGEKTLNGRKAHCPRGHRYDEENTRICKGKRYCKSCMRDHQRRSRGTHPSRFRTPIEPRLSEALRLVAEGMSANRAAQVAKVGLSTIARARR